MERVSAGMRHPGLVSCQEWFKTVADRCSEFLHHILCSDVIVLPSCAGDGERTREKSIYLYICYMKGILRQETIASHLASLRVREQRWQDKSNKSHQGSKDSLWKNKHILRTNTHSVMGIRKSREGKGEVFTSTDDPRTIQESEHSSPQSKIHAQLLTPPRS